ncbi:MAG: HAMP domain-containing histidine kinase [Clostridiales bacterium]|nr:HAMP domain-containing histidine kinase [Clostridiales bacterium]
MKKPHLKTKILLKLVGVTCAVLLVVVLAFNLSIRSYINARINSQLHDISSSVSDERQGGPGKRFDERPDRVTGARGNALILTEDGELAGVLHGDETAAKSIAESFGEGKLDENGSFATIRTDDGVYAVTVGDDPLTKGARLVSYIEITAITGLASRMNLILVIVTAAAILLCVILSRIFAKQLAKPVQSLSEYAHDIGEGNLEPREMEFKDAEFSGLADSMNRMAAALKESRSRQEVFFQNVSHELRTPLTSIRGSAEGIVCGVMEPAAAGKTIMRESDKLTSMVEDILYISRIEKAGAACADPIDIRDVLSLCVSEQRTDAESRGIRFEFDFDDAPAMVRIPEKDGERIFGNIISNAIRYAESTVSLSCHAEGEEAVVRIRDDGPGIPEKDLPHIFERFYKGEGGKHGIGLSIAMEAAKAYGGSLTAANDPGAVFNITFPKA